jgi:ubiquinone/menaquinone biosynthesis C-methylase UbiE
MDVSRQYKTSANLDVRIALHEKYSTNAYEWQLWVFDQFAPFLTHEKKLLNIVEIGCGTGKLWQFNQHRIAPNWHITLTDQSAGMMEVCQRNLAHIQTVAFIHCPADDLPMPAESVDVIIANHMLYHVPNVDATLRALNLRLKIGGYLVAATNGVKHMRQLDELVNAFDVGMKFQSVTKPFNLQNGAEQILRHFRHVSEHRHDSDLIVTDPQAVIDYALSMLGATEMSDDRRTAFADHVGKHFATLNQRMFIQKESGLFLAQK